MEPLLCLWAKSHPKSPLAGWLFFSQRQDFVGPAVNKATVTARSRREEDAESEGVLGAFHFQCSQSILYHYFFSPSVCCFAKAVTFLWFQPG